jgi:hypothetical protein
MVMCTPRTFEPGTPEGAAEPLRVPAGAARAGRLTEATLPTDRTGLATWKAGDYVLANERIALLIEAARPSSGYDPWGGKPIGVARIEGGRLVDAGDFNEVMLGLGRHTLATERVTVLRDGSQGGPAVVRAVGPMRPIPFIDEFGRAFVRANYDDVHVAYDYELAPSADHVDVYATYDVQNTFGYQVSIVTHAFFQGYRMQRFFPGFGFFETGSDGTPPNARAVVWVDDEATSWAWQIPTGMLSQFISVSGFDLFNPPMMELPPCNRPADRVRLGQIVIGGRGLDGIQQALARTNNTRLRRITGTVTDGAGMPAAGVRVHASVQRAAMMGSPMVDELLTRTTTDAMGGFALHVPEGMAVSLRGYRAGNVVAGPMTVAPAATAAMLTLAPAGSVRVVVREADTMGAMSPLPARVQLIPMGLSVPTVPENFGERTWPNERMHVEFTLDGDVTLRAPPGRYRVVASHGYEYDLGDAMVTVMPGMTTEVPFTLRRVVDTTGVQCGDFHIHSTRSPDSRDSGRYKLASAAADGLEVAARSEHEFVAEWSSLVREMGIERWVYGLTSLELTTFVWGHFGVFPLEVDATRPNGGAFEWVGRTPPQVFADVRARREQPVLVINHPRGANAGGYFSAAGYDRNTGMVRRPDLWDDRFTAVEVFNDASYYTPSNRENVDDWFSFLNRGRRVFAVGSSDSHTIVRNSPVGYPRTCMYLGNDDPRMVTHDSIRSTVGGGRTYISGGVYIDVSATPAAGGMGTAGPGQELRNAGAMVRLNVRVQAAPWVNTDRLEVIVNGQVAQTVMLDASRRDPMNPTVRFRGDLMVPVPAAGGWLIVAANGAELAPVHPGRSAFGVTNPIFLVR